MKNVKKYKNPRPDGRRKLEQGKEKRKPAKQKPPPKRRRENIILISYLCEVLHRHSSSFVIELFDASISDKT